MLKEKLEMFLEGKECKERLAELETQNIKLGNVWTEENEIENKKIMGGKYLEKVIKEESNKIVRKMQKLETSKERMVIRKEIMALKKTDLKEIINEVIK